MKTGKALLGIVAGVALGTLLGALIVSSKKGVPRKVILQSGEDLTDAIDERLDRKFAHMDQRFDDLIKNIIGKKS